MSTRWDSETTMKFIQEYKMHECLWNCNSPGYKSKRLRDAAYGEIVKIMSLPGFGVPEAKIKIKNLRSTYFQELKKIANSKMAGGESVYTPNLKWFGELDVILNDAEPRRMVLENNEEEEEMDVFQETYASSLQNVTDVSVDSASRLQSPTVTRLVKASKGRSKDITRAVNELKHLQNSIYKDIPANQFDIFGSSVAAQLKSLPYDKALMAQSQIQTMLTNIAIEDYRNNISSEETEVILP